ncbi:MAG: glutamine synthetase type III [Ruminococcaceae bacterium]|nr:glutamine synthetase type III [Oscillospiraceae bacterium]
MKSNNFVSNFGSKVFSDDVMKAMLPDDTYNALINTVKSGKELDISVANTVANAMKDWALEKGATHYSHWFQPLTGITAEKHDSFLSSDKDGKPVIEFSGKCLIKGEPDASSFPSGGLRATFEARGYTAWDPTSYAFIKDNTLCIPTVFCSHGGEALDQKTPLLRSMELISEQALRVLKLFGKEATRVNTTVGAEQEYFLIDRELYNKRTDLLFCGRTLFGAKPPKGQELDDHYFGAIKPRIISFMKELDEELWSMGVFAKTEHNEAAPAQHELAPIYTMANIACDHNQLIMETMRNVAHRHGLVCLLHEKPFAGFNGSGKHNNWSLFTDTGFNLLNPGKSPAENTQFLLFLSAVIKSVDEYQSLLRIAVAGAGNDHRLGAAEAPPAIISIFLGDELTEIIESIINDTHYQKAQKTNLEIGVNALPNIPKETTDRNRTSPFAFTGNKFEFRMVGSSQSIAITNTMLNTIVADALKTFADHLEACPEEDFKKNVTALIKETLSKHKRILFNGDGYSEEWKKEAVSRGLLNLESTVDALPHFLDNENINLLAKYGILKESEIHSHYEIMMETYNKTVNIECMTMLDMIMKDILPSVSKYSTKLSEAIINKQKALPSLQCLFEKETLEKLSNLLDEIYMLYSELKNESENVPFGKSSLEIGIHMKEKILPLMSKLRKSVDEAQLYVSTDYWPYPNYTDLIYKI